MTTGPRCWSCGSGNDAAVGIGETDPGEPSEGAVSVCAYCGAVSVFTGSGLDLRKPAAWELADMLQDPTIRAAVNAVRHRNMTGGGWM